MKKTMIFVVVSFFMLTATQSFAQIYISFEGVKGESTLAEFPSSTQINSLEWESKNVQSRRAVGGGGSVGRTEVGDLVFTKTRGLASSALQMFVFNGKSIPKAEIRFYKEENRNKVAYLTITLENVTITSWAISGSGSQAPSETFSLNFAKFKSEDASMKTGTGEKLEKQPAVGWDFQKNASY